MEVRLTMLPSPPPERRPSLGSRVLSLIARHGSPEERRLATTHEKALAAFLDHPDTARFGRHGALEIGLENRPVLKFTLNSSSRVSPWLLINDLAERNPILSDTAELVLRHKLRCHAGIKLSVTGAEYEIYPYETPEKLLATRLFSGFSPDQSSLPAKLYFFGYSSNGELSAYADVREVDTSELETAIGFSLPSGGLAISALLHSRRKPDGSWRADKAGIEFKPFPSHMLNAVLAHMSLNFSYLLYRGGTRRYGIIGIHGTRQVFYTTLTPLQTRNTSANTQMP